MSDNISDFLTIIRNAYRASQESCTARYSRIHRSIAEILKEEGYLQDVQESSDERGHKRLVLTLKYVDDTPALLGIQRVSRPGRRLYYGSGEIPRTVGGLGIGILTTSRGILRDRDARKQNVGGELICSVW